MYLDLSKCKRYGESRSIDFLSCSWRWHRPAARNLAARKFPLWTTRVLSFVTNLPFQNTCDAIHYSNELWKLTKPYDFQIDIKLCNIHSKLNKKRYNGNSFENEEIIFFKKVDNICEPSSIRPCPRNWSKEYSLRWHWIRQQKRYHRKKTPYRIASAAKSMHQRLFRLPNSASHGYAPTQSFPLQRSFLSYDPLH